jgi:glycosyltransferase involved in cell wall biosynthesis
MPNKKKLSIVTAVYNNEVSLIPLHTNLKLITNDLFEDVEHIFVNDGSNDNSLTVLRKLSASDNRVKIIDLTRNFGQHEAILTGLDYASGDLIFLIDADLEENPKYLVDFVSKLNEGYDIIIGNHQEQRKNLTRVILTKSYSILHNLICDYKIIPNASNMRIFTRQYKNHLLSFGEPAYIGGFCSWIGSQQGTIQIKRSHQNHKSQYSLKKLFHHAHKGIFGFSTKLMRLVSLAGVFVSLISFLYSLYIIYGHVFLERNLPGFTSIFILQSFFMGILFVFLGIQSEYIMEIFIQTKNRPLSLIKSTINIKN